jgi:hypothetical protein
MWEKFEALPTWYKVFLVLDFVAFIVVGSFIYHLDWYWWSKILLFWLELTFFIVLTLGMLGFALIRQFADYRAKLGRYGGK